VGEFDTYIMGRVKILIFIFLNALTGVASSQVKVRLFANRLPESAVFTVISGRYDVAFINGENIQVSKNDAVIILRFKGKIAVKVRNSAGYIADSVFFTGLTGKDSFSLRINGPAPAQQNYSGDLYCFDDLDTFVLINNCDTDDYIAGVVKAEGGSGKNKEYFKTQAVLARTYMYKYFDKHMSDRFSVCDNTHCQAFNGISDDTLINLASLETRGLVITDKDSMLIMSAFHSNCGGETSSSGDVWLTAKPYLKKVNDPYCFSSKNAVWEKKVILSDWCALLNKSGYSGMADDPLAFKFIQKSRMREYMAGSFTMPLNTIRTELALRSTFFSVVPGKDFLILRGRGYGHGVGLCQEGAMEMAARGFNFREIIDFYYAGVSIRDVKNAVILSEKQ